MLDTLQKMSGTTHKVFKDQRTVTKHLDRLFWRNDGTVSETVSVKEVPTISYNDMAFIPMCNSVVFRAGDSPIWNRNQTCLPMSWRLFDNTIVKPGKKFSLQTIPTLSSALDFDVRQNQPDFIKMWEKRQEQALLTKDVKAAFKDAYRYTDDDIARLDPDAYSDELMEIINDEMARKAAENGQAGDTQPEEQAPEYTDNKDFKDAVVNSETLSKNWNEPRYADGLLSRASIQPFPDTPKFNHGLDDKIIKAFTECRSAFGNDTDNFQLRSDGSLYSADGKPYLRRTMSDADLERMREASKESDSRIYTDEARKLSGELKGFEVTEHFYKFLIGQDSWTGFASGRFDAAMTKLLLT